MLVVLRNEKKFLISIADYYKNSAYLGCLIAEDQHNGSSGYRVRSLYFDTIYDTDHFEKASGVELRRKVRLRIYDPRADYAFLEMKQKQGANQLKRSLKVSRGDAEELIKGNITPLLHYKEDFAKEMYGFMVYRCYRPKTIVEYLRKAYVAKENKIRITFDREIRSTESNMDLFSPDLIMNPVMDPYNAVLEVKFNGFLLEYIKNMLKDIDKSELSVSKYSLARQHACLTRL